MAAAADAIAKARHPLVIAGEMVTFEAAGDELVTFMEALGAPLMSAYRQQDVFPNEHPAYAGHLEINRPGFQREALARADLVLAVGTRLDGITTEDFALLDAGKPLLQIYPDERVLARCAAHVAIDGHMGPVLSGLRPRLGKPIGPLGAWRDALHEAFLALSAPERGDARGAVNMAAVVDTVAHAVPREATVVTDGGSFARWVHRYHRFSLPRTFAGPVSGAMGYAVPGALGAALARPDAPVLAFVGDGGYMMTGQELTTAAAENLNITILVCDNQAHGSILHAQWQRFDHGSDYATRLASPDFVAMAGACGVPAWRVERTGEFPEALGAALAHDGPTLLHVLTDQRDIAPSGPEDDVV
jgi:acetolactate synthase-1/2/3 large subunit